MHDVRQYQIWTIDGQHARVGSVLGDEVEMHLRGLSGVSDVRRLSAKSMLANPERFKFIRDGRPLKTKSELETLIMEKALQHPVCPEGMGVQILWGEPRGDYIHRRGRTTNDGAPPCHGSVSRMTLADP
jgi:hypothetical protein